MKGVLGVLFFLVLVLGVLVMIVLLPNKRNQPISRQFIQNIPDLVYSQIHLLRNQELINIPLTKQNLNNPTSIDPSQFLDEIVQKFNLHIS